LIVGVLSDTHDNVELISRAARLFREHGAEAVIHLGDIVSPPALRRLAMESPGPVYAVYGNNCGEKLGLQRVAEKHGARIWEPPAELELAGRRLLLVHGFGSPEHTRRIVYALADGGGWDAVLYGHTHQAEVAYRRGVLVLNPGAASTILSKPTAAVLELDLMRARIVEL